MTLRIATWNMQGEGKKLHPEDLIKLLLDPGTSKKTLTQIDLIALQEVSLKKDSGEKYDARLREALKAHSVGDSKKYEVSVLARSKTSGDQTSFKIEIRKNLRSDTATLESPQQATLAPDDGYLLVYDPQKLTLISPTQADHEGQQGNHTLKYVGVQPEGSADSILASQRASLVDTGTDGKETFNAVNVQALFNRRPMLSRFRHNVGEGGDLHVFNWHAPEGGRRQDALPALRMFERHNFDSLPEISNDDIVLVMGDLNEERRYMPEFFGNGNTRSHESKKWDHIILGGSDNFRLKRVAGVADLISKGFSDHQWVVADIEENSSAKRGAAAPAEKEPVKRQRRRTSTSGT